MQPDEKQNPQFRNTLKISITLKEDTQPWGILQLLNTII